MSSSTHKKIPFITFLLVIANVVMFIITEVTGSSLDAVHVWKWGGLFIPDILEEGKYYELFTSTFLHFGFSHLLNNMFMLAVAGSLLERAIGHIRFLVLYFLSGLGGTVLTTVVRAMGLENDNSIIAGASGAIFGVIGGLLIVSIRTKGRYRDLTGRNLIIMIVLSLVYGFTTVSVDIWGHAGGLVVGILAGIPIVLSCKSLRVYDYQEFNY